MIWEANKKAAFESSFFVGASGKPRERGWG